MENNNGRGIFYGVIGVATLVVAIIGATFAYFASVTSANGDAINGTTSTVAGSLSVSVEKLDFDGAAAKSNNLVPSDIDGSVDTINAALNAKCEDEGYTGCHLYKITASSEEEVSAASINLDTLTVTATVTSDWNYAIYSGSDTSATDVLKTSTFKGFTSYDMHEGAALAAGEEYTYYLLIWLKDDNGSQNAGDTNDATGTYSGTVTMSAGSGGKISATFSTSTGA